MQLAHYIGLLTNHHQPELAETFFNSVTTKILHRTYFHNDFIAILQLTHAGRCAAEDEIAIGEIHAPGDDWLSSSAADVEICSSLQGEFATHQVDAAR